MSDVLGVPNSCGYATVTKGANSLDWLTLDSANIADGYFDVIVQMDADAPWSLLGNNIQQIVLQIPGSASAYRLDNFDVDVECPETAVPIITGPVLEPFETFDIAGSEDKII